MFCSKNILTEVVAITSVFVSVSRFVVGTISLICELFFSGVVLVHLRSAQLCTENSVSFHMRSAVEVA